MEDPSGATVVAEHCELRSGTLDDPWLHVEALSLHAAAALARGDLAASREHLSNAGQLHVLSPDLATATHQAMLAAQLALLTGGFARAVEEADRAVELADRRGDLELRFQARAIACLVHGDLGMRDARRRTEEALALSRRLGPWEESQARINTSVLLMLDGALEAAEIEVTRALRTLEALRDRHPISLAAAYGTRADIRLAAGQPEAALSDAETCCQIVGQRDEPNPYTLAEARRVYLEALIAVGRLDAALASGYETLDWLGNRAPQSQRKIMSKLAEALRQSGRLAEAYEMLSNASTLQRLEFRELAGQLHDQADEDWLTGARNRRFLAHRLALCTITETPVGLVFVDLDRFKSINDAFGHHVGDEVLARVAALLRAEQDDPEQVIRTGGDEFLLLLTGPQADEAHARAEKARSAISGYDWSKLHPRLAVTVSAGAVSSNGSSDPGTLLQIASDGLNAAKRGGRDRVGAISATRVENHGLARQ